MKRLVLILAALVAVVALAMPVVADDTLRIDGEFTFAMITAFDSIEDGGGFDNAYFDFFITPDEFNEVFIELGYAKAFDYSPVAGGDQTVTAKYFSLRTDVGAALGLPIGVVNTAGVDSLYTNKYEVTGHSYERIPIRSFIDPVPWKIKLDGGMWQFTFGIGWGQTTATEPKGAYNDIGGYLFLPEVLMGEWEFFYLANNDPDFKGRLGFSYSTDQLMGGRLGVAGGFVYDLRDDAVRGTAEQWAWGAGAAWVQGGLDAGVSAWGRDDYEFYWLGVDVDYMLTEVFGVGAATGFNFSTEGTEETWRGLDVYGKAMVAGAKWQVGYLYRNDTSGYAYSWTPIQYYGAAPEAAPDGGLYFLVDIDF
jgi:hypothetical protein